MFDATFNSGNTAIFGDVWWQAVPQVNNVVMKVQIITVIKNFCYTVWSS